MAYTKYTVPFDITVILAYISDVVNSGTDYTYTNFTDYQAVAETDQTSYDALPWADARPKPTWADTLTYKAAAFAYFVQTPSTVAIAANIEDYLHTEDLDDRIAAVETITATLNSASTHSASDFATPSDITTAINALLNGAGTAYDTLKELQNIIQSDETVAAALAALVAGKIDFTTTLSGLSTSTNSAITSSDNILSALGKLQAQLTATNAKFTRTTSSLTLSVVGTGATGTQIHATKDSTIHVNLSNSNTSSIGGPSVSDLIVKMCATNSATESDWITQADADNEQTVTLALALQSVQVIHEMITVDVPGGYYIKIESSGSGTHTEAILRGQKTIYG